MPVTFDRIRLDAPAARLARSRYAPAIRAAVTIGCWRSFTHGLDLDASTPGVLRWLEHNARRFGFRRTVPTEPWHWEW